jgi:hypothetical protein
VSYFYPEDGGRGFSKTLVATYQTVYHHFPEACDLVLLFAVAYV